MLLLISHSLGLTPFLKGEHPVMQPIAKMFAHSFKSYGWLKGPQTIWDMIMPAFMFAMGVSMFLSGKGRAVRECRQVGHCPAGREACRSALSLGQYHPWHSASSIWNSMCLASCRKSPTFTS